MSQEKLSALNPELPLTDPDVKSYELRPQVS
jgi:hypothetical protein